MPGAPDCKRDKSMGISPSGLLSGKNCICIFVVIYSYLHICICSRKRAGNRREGGVSGCLRRMEWPETRAGNRLEGGVNGCLRKMEWPEEQAETADGVKDDVRRTACVIGQGYARLQFDRSCGIIETVYSAELKERFNGEDEVTQRYCTMLQFRKLHEKVHRISSYRR